MCTVSQSCLTVCDPMDGSPSDSSVHGISLKGDSSEFPFSFPGDLPGPGIKPVSPALQADSLPLAPTGKPCVTNTIMILLVVLLGIHC